MSRSSLVLIIGILAILPGFSAGTGSPDGTRVKDPASWKESVDITDMATGKYNFYIKAGDLGGNVQVAGPYNIFIDPESDLPVAGITNPRNGMRVPGNLNIVGTCVDDDGVDYVELVLDNNAEAPIRAEGKEFWSYYLDTTKMEEGAHTLSVYGVDIHGLKGKAKKVIWNLDRKKPVSHVDNHALGSLVSGNITLSGTVSDGNGIDTLSYSLDKGKTFIPVQLKKDKKSNSCSFTVPVDTRKRADGPSVCWFKAKDLQGTTGIYTFLFFVDNTRPEVRILYPDSKMAVNGKFMVAGYAGDALGLSSLSWKLGKETGTFDLTLGNPWWVKDFDITGQNIKDAELEITAVDTSGNSTTSKRKLLVDQNADRPVVTLVSPVKGSVAQGSELLVAGLAHDDDGVASVYYSLDGGAPTEVATDGSFYIHAASVAAGKHRISVWAKDINGIEGPRVELADITCAGQLPAIAVENLSLAAQSASKADQRQIPFVSGMEVHPEAGGVLSGTITSGSAIASVSWRIGDMDEQKTDFSPKVTTGGKTPFRINLPADIPYGPVPIAISATDIYNRKTTIGDLLYVTDLTRVRGDPAVVFEDVRISGDGTVVLDQSYPLSGFFVGGKAAKVHLEPVSKLAVLEQSGNLLSIKPVGKPGSEQGIAVVVESDKGFRYVSRPFNFRVEGKPVSIAIADASLRSGSEPIKVSGTISADIPLSVRQWRLLSSPGSAAENIGGDIPVDAKTGAFSFTVDADKISEGASIIEVSAATGGLVRTVYVPVFRAGESAGSTADAKTPPPVISWLESGALYYFVSYKGSVASSALSVDGKPLEGTGSASVGAVPFDSLTPGLHAVSLKVTDDRGKSVLSSYKLNVKPPKAHIRFSALASAPWSSGMIIEMPREGLKGASAVAIVDSVNPVVSASMKVGAAASVRGVIRKLEGTEWEISCPLPPGLAADKTPISIIAEIKDGDPIEASGIFVIVRPKDPSAVSSRESFVWVNAERRADGSLLLDSARSLDGFYNGRPLASVSTEKPVKDFSCTIVDGLVRISTAQDGLYPSVRLVLKDIDGWVFKTEPFTFLADSEPPVLAVNEPADGKWIKDSVRLKIIATDKNKITSTEYSTDNGNAWLPLDSRDEVIDLSSLPDGLVVLQVRATDESGRSSVVSLGMHKDTTAPVVSVIVPSTGEKVNGEIRIGLAVSDAGKIVSAEYQREVPPAPKPAAGKKASASPDAPEWIPLDPSRFVTCMVGTAEKPLSGAMKVRFTDASGNATVIDTWPFTIDRDSDLPVAEIHLPEENEVVTSDFVVSGVVYDDDRPAKIWYRIDAGKEVSIEAVNGYSIPVSLNSLTDNEHSVTVYAEDVYGVKGNPVTRNFRVSLEEPKAQVLKPEYDHTNKGMLEISGTASDKNGVGQVQISIDNGNSFNDAVGTESWKYSFDTKIIQDGTHVVFVKVWDKYGIEGLYSSLINVDNTAPEISLELPLDGAKTVGPVFISGQTTDRVDLRNVMINIRSLSGNPVPATLAAMKMSADAILAKPVDLTGLADGLYNIDVSGEDAAGNVTRVSRNITLDKKSDRNRIECLYPLNGQHLQGTFNLYGQVFATDPVKTVTLYIDGSAAQTEPVTTTGYYCFTLTPELITAGTHKLVVKSEFGGGPSVSSGSLEVNYKQDGPWVTIENLVMGDFAFERPWLTGSAGYVLTPEEKSVLENKKSSKQEKAVIAAKQLAMVEISFDNGKSFSAVEAKKGGWRYRVESQDMTAGYHFLIVRAKMADGTAAITRTIIQIDKTAPRIRLISPGEGGRYNQKIEFSGLASDDTSLSYVDYALRKGDKAAYELPGFIQGLYFDGHFWGATLYDFGMGLTFFNDNVKLQVQYGQFTDSQWAKFMSAKMRFGGSVFGAKLLANLFYLPMSYFGGPDWSWLSATVALGANFSMFTETQSGEPQTLSAVLAQIEFPRVTIPKRSMFRTFALYTEFQLWFIPTDVKTSEVSVQSLIPHVTVGARVNVF